MDITLRGASARIGKNGVPQPRSLVWKKQQGEQRKGTEQETKIFSTLPVQAFKQTPANKIINHRAELHVIVCSGTLRPVVASTLQATRVGMVNMP